jgi:ankyrin repeat protein
MWPLRFRWVVCQLERLRRCFPSSIRGTLANLPESLDETYEQALSGIDEEKRVHAQRMFQCLMVSIRPLHVEELVEILAFCFDSGATHEFNANWRPPEDAEEAVLSACSSLISIVNVDGSRIAQFSHFSVKEFLTSERLAAANPCLSRYHILPESAHATFAHASLSVLVQLDENLDNNVTRHLPLALYAARHWVEHAQFGNLSPQIQDLMERLFDWKRPHFAGWIWLHDIDHHWVESMSKPCPTRSEAAPLYYAALCGFHGLVERLISVHPEDVHTRRGFHTTSLHAASIKGHFSVTLLLLKYRADPSSYDDEGWTPLHRASKSGHLDIVRLLLGYGAAVNSFNMWLQTPLYRASINGKVNVARLLLEHGATVNSRDDLFITPLHRASQNGFVDVVELLPNRGANVRARDTKAWTPLHIAARNGHVTVVELLLKFGADVNASDKAECTPLHVASQVGHGEVVRLLLKNGADVNAQNENRDTPWDLATSEVKLDVAKFPLTIAPEDRTSLHTALRNGCLDVVRS